MMQIPAFIFGIGLPTLSGVLFLALLEKNHPVLARTERLALGFILGMAYTMFLTFLIHVTTGIALALPLFLGIQIITLGILLGLAHKDKKEILEIIFNFQFSIFNSSSIPLWQKRLCQLLLIFLAIKILITSVTFLLLSPIYLDDSLDNWNMRGKVFFYDQAITLTLPGENPETSAQGVSSYPPTVPLVKTWVSTLAGEWHEPLVNSIHITWYLAALALVFFAILRQAGRAWAFAGLLMIGGMPLYLMHGTNAYADAFLSVHVFAAVSMLFHAVHRKNSEEQMIFFRISAIATAILPFTKNEAMLVYLPPLLLITAASLLWMYKKGIPARQMWAAALWYAIPFVLVCGPWLLYKWMNGMTFGNGKAVGSLGIGWHENVLHAIGINTFFEGNWLLLFPLLFILLILRWKKAATSLSILSAFFLIIYVGQVLLYLFTDLATEALRQTGYARGLVQLTPTIILLTVLLLKDAFPKLFYKDTP